MSNSTNRITLDTRRELITWASRGLGADIVAVPADAGANLVLFCVSPAANYICGQVLDIKGGLPAG